MGDWSPKNKPAEEAEEMGFGTLGGAEDMREFAAEDYTGPSWNFFKDAGKWITQQLRKLKGK